MTDRKQLAFSVLDLAPVAEGSTPAVALHNSLELAQHSEQLGYSRYWVAEHHNIISVAIAATSIIIAYIAAGTKNIRVGSGGIMLPNHSPLIVSEQFGTLAALYTNRIDLGLGRAPGTDPVTAAELRYDRMRAAQYFPNEVRKIQQYFSVENRNSEVRSVLSEGADMPIYILGSSTDSAYLAAELGLPYAFASHFAPQMLIAALKIYRDNFKPSAQLDKPYVIVGSQVVAAETDDEAEYLASTMRRSFMGIITGRRELMQPPTRHLGYEKWGIIKTQIDQMLACSLIGGKEKIERELQELIANTDADEIIVSSHIYDQQKRLDSYRIFSEVAKDFEY
ncbi:LLM class flavin-dependent oxidoreductase [Draconibacterium orientale]|uniref:LLM class flavin-dependent oxidoreductase n=1 Tax=Draconibacterium orientale TaxID=1168034 RepID=UPI002A0A3B74|nr:LLM class flavin-dependent oxidoreductase [Draconibacterium orientale]